MQAPTDSMLVEFIRYNAWANLKLLDVCQALTPEQLATGAPGAYGSIYRTLEHLIDSEAFYYSLLTGEQLPAPFRWADKPAVGQIRDYCADVGQAMIRAAAQVQPDDLGYAFPAFLALFADLPIIMALPDFLLLARTGYRYGRSSSCRRR